MIRESYIRFYYFVKDKINPNGLSKFELEKDLEGDFLNNFKLRPDSKFINNMTEIDLLNYLSEINLFSTSFYEGMDYSLDRLYKKLNEKEKKEFCSIIEDLSTDVSNIIKKISNDYADSSRVREKWDSLPDMVFNLNFNNPLEISKLIDYIFLDVPFKNVIVNKIIEVLKSVGFEFENINTVLDMCKNDFEGLKETIDLLMSVNPKITIYYRDEIRLFVQNYLDEIHKNSIYLINLFIHITKNNKNKKRFIPRYTMLKVQYDKPNPEPLSDLNEIDSFLPNITSEIDFHYTYLDFRKHLIALILKLINIIASIGPSGKLKNLPTEIKNSIKITFNNKEDKVNLINYVNDLLDVLSGNSDKIPNLISYCKENKDLIHKLITDNKDIIFNIVSDMLFKLGVNRSETILNKFKDIINIDIEGSLTKYLNELESNPEIEKKVKSVLYLISKITYFINNLKPRKVKV
jgi:hypothetical protein